MKKQEEAIKMLKEKFTKKLILAVPDLNKKIGMEVDALDYTMGGVLSIECEDRR